MARYFLESATITFRTPGGEDFPTKKHTFLERARGKPEIMTNIILYYMERLAERWAYTLSKELNLDELQREMVAYGLKLLLSLAFSYSLTFLLAYLLGVWELALVAVLTGALLRGISGGAHSSSPYICGVFGAVLSSLLAIAARSAGEPPSIALFTLVVVALYVIARWVPAGNPRRPPPTPGRRRFFRLASTLFVVVWGFVAGLWGIDILRIPGEYVTASALGLGWQVFSLTPVGYWSLGKMDAFFLKALHRILHQGGDPQC